MNYVPGTLIDRSSSINVLNDIVMIISVTDGLLSQDLKRVHYLRLNRRGLTMFKFSMQLSDTTSYELIVDASRDIE